MADFNKYIDFNKEVDEGLKRGKAVVALESTIISHGMPYPQNVKTANECEKIIRDAGAVPATIAIINGRIKIGIDKDELTLLATAKNIKKVSRRDMAAVIAGKETGATTVAATMICAQMAGIKFFVTGGVGGVHRGYEETMDVSADLEELAQTNVTVICAGAKSILDLPRTLEYLETKGVPVVGYKTDTLPQFFTRESDYKLQLRMDSPADIAKMVKAKDDLGLKGGILVTNPIPEKYSMDKSYIDSMIDKAIQKAKEENVHGKDVTPYLLSYIVEETKGSSLEANMHLVYNNACLGAEIAVAYNAISAMH